MKILVLLQLEYCTTAAPKAVPLLQEAKLAQKRNSNFECRMYFEQNDIKISVRLFYDRYIPKPKDRQNL